MKEFKAIVITALIIIGMIFIPYLIGLLVLFLLNVKESIGVCWAMGLSVGVITVVLILIIDMIYTYVKNELL